MAEFNANGLLIALGALNLCILVFVLPHLCRTSDCRIATLFAGLHAGIITTFLVLDDWASGGDINQAVLTKFLLVTLPKVYIPALIIGSYVLPKFVLSASTHLSVMFLGLMTAFLNYFATYFAVGIVDFALRASLGRPFPAEGLMQNMMILLQHTFQMDLYFTTASIVSALVSMIGAVAIAQKAEGSTL